ncbi:hypothetical protein B0H17DRAFT_1329599 [Mycena rosella]|uniref:N-acetyltransferase domain-containing protein n=1 Tax=Mycena rosella TaxID=1033263 RepID=A0AAD7DNA5_MYCRO|nr:hypothetical protein B0H17DRAFT_1329599 [Mycena rosella]
MPALTGDNIVVSDGLEGQDDHFEKISALWEELQLCAVDIAANPECDVLSFSQSAFYLGVITVILNVEKNGVPLPTANPPRVEPFMFDMDSPSHTSARPQEESPWFHRSGSVNDDSEDVGNSAADLRTDAVDTYAAWDPVPNDDLRSPLFPPMKKPRVSEERTRRGSLLGPNRDLEERDVTDNSPWSSGPSGTSGRYAKPSPPMPVYDTYIGQKGSSSTWGGPLPNRETRDELVKAVEARASKKVVGLIYLAASPLAPSPPDQVGELNLGIILDAAHRGKGYAREAIQLILKYAFNVRQCHRIQASLLHSSTKDRMVSLLTHMRFGHEGTKRLAFFNPMMAEWQDVTTLAMLDTDWAMRRLYKSAPKSLWDELFMRHERERDELLRWEETQGRLKRGMTSSMETLRALPLETDSSNASDAGESSSSSAMSMSKGKKRALHSSRRDPYDGFSSDADSEFNDTMFVRRRVSPDAASRRSGASSPALSDASLESVPNSVTTNGSVEWDMLDSSESGSSSFSDSE